MSTRGWDELDFAREKVKELTATNNAMLDQLISAYQILQGLGITTDCDFMRGIEQAIERTISERNARI